MWIPSGAPKRQIGQLIVESAQAISADRERSAASFHWWRDSWSDIQRYKDGITLDTAGLSPAITALAKVLPPQSREQNDQSWVQLTRDQYVKTAAAFGVVVVRDASDSAQRAGARVEAESHPRLTRSIIASTCIAGTAARAGLLSLIRLSQEPVCHGLAWRAGKAQHGQPLLDPRH